MTAELRKAYEEWSYRPVCADDMYESDTHLLAFAAGAAHERRQRQAVTAPFDLDSMAERFHMLAESIACRPRDRIMMRAVAALVERLRREDEE